VILSGNTESSITPQQQAEAAAGTSSGAAPPSPTQPPPPPRQQAQQQQQQQQGQQRAEPPGHLVISPTAGIAVVDLGEKHPLRAHWEYLCYLFRKMPELGDKAIMEAGYR
jgi:hypothetical protein